MKSRHQFRDCKPSELGLLQELVEELYYTDAGPDVSVPDVSVTYRALKRKPDKGRLVVFQRDEEVVGYAILIFFFSNEFGGDLVDIDEILVTESARGEGVGKAFFKWLARTYKKAVGWSLQVRPGNRKARRLYASQGFLASTNLHLYNIFEYNEAEAEQGGYVERRTASRKQPITEIDKKLIRSRAAREVKPRTKAPSVRRNHSAASKKRAPAAKHKRSSRAK